MTEILICDDDKKYGDLLADFLTTAGNSATRAYDAEYAVEMLKDHFPGLIILDMQLPNGGGPRVMSYIQARATNTPVIICSGMPLEQQKQWCSGLPNARCLQKPVSPSELQEAIESFFPGASR